MVVYRVGQVSGLVSALTALVCWRPAGLAGFFVDRFLWCSCGSKAPGDVAPMVDEIMGSILTTTKHAGTVRQVALRWYWWNGYRIGPPDG